MNGRHTLLQTNSNNIRKEASIFQAEATEIYSAAKYLIDNPNPSHKYVRIFSNSQAVLKALKKDVVKSKTILDTHNMLNKLTEQIHMLTLVWIKGHHGLETNELADEYAKIGTKDTQNYSFTNTTKQEIKKPHRYKVQ